MSRLSQSVAVLSALLCGACVCERPEEPSCLVAKISDCDRLASLNPHFAKAFAFLKRADLAELKPGRYDIDGDDCWAMVQDVELTPMEAESTVELHHRHIDIQSPLTGPETFALMKPTAEQIALPGDAEKDYTLFKAAGERTVTLQPGEFILLFPPKDAHAPCHTEGAPRKIRKVIVKVRTRY